MPLAGGGVCEIPSFAPVARPLKELYITFFNIELNKMYRLDWKKLLGERHNFHTKFSLPSALLFHHPIEAYLQSAVLQNIPGLHLLHLAIVSHFKH